METLTPASAVTQPPVELKHSGMGIASFVISIIAGVALLVSTVMAGIMTIKAGGEMSETSVEAIVLGLLIIAFLFMALVGLGLGIAGCVQAGRKRTFAILGIAFNACLVLGMAGLVVLGTVAR